MKLETGVDFSFTGHYISWAPSLMMKIWLTSGSEVPVWVRSELGRKCNGMTRNNTDCPSIGRRAVHRIEIISRVQLKILHKTLGKIRRRVWRVDDDKMRDIYTSVIKRVPTFRPSANFDICAPSFGRKP